MEIAIQFFMLTGIILMIIAIVSIFKLENTIKEWQREIAENEEKKQEVKRVHPTISEVNFDNVLTGREDIYNKYKNKDGLYEPVRTKNGIEIKPRKED